MPDEADDLILKMQHLEAEARAQEEARRAAEGAAQMKSAAQKMAVQAQAELDAAQEALRSAEEKQARGRAPNIAPLDAADLLVQGKAEAEDARRRIVKARARLDFALGRMDEAERREWDALQARARAEAHAQLASDKP